MTARPTCRTCWTGSSAVAKDGARSRVAPGTTDVVPIAEVVGAA